MVASTHRMADRLRRSSPGVWLGLYVALAVGILPLLGAMSWAAAAASAGDLLPKAAAVWLALRIAGSPEHPSRVRQAWALIAAAIGLLLVAELAARMLQATDPGSPWIRWIALIYIPVHPLLLAALLRFQRLFESRTAALCFMLDALIVMLGAAMVLWALVLEPALSPGFANLPAGQRLMAIAYPAGDLLLLYGVATVLVRRPLGSLRRLYGWLAAALCFALLGDLTWTRGLARGAAAEGMLPHLLWLISPWCLFMAGQVQQRTAGFGLIDAAPTDPGFSILPYAATLLAAGLLVILGLFPEGRSLSVLMVLAAALFAAVIGRMALTQARSVRLVREKAEQEGAVRRDALLEHSADAIVVIDAERRIRYANPGFRRMMGRRTPAGEPFAPCVAEADRARLESILRRTGGAGAHRARLRLANETERVIVEAAISELAGDEADGAAMVINLRDVTEQVALERQLSERMLRDPLTGMPNRALFLDRTAQALARAERSERTVAVLLADLDRFKVVNDTRGHAAGDQVLIQAAERLIEAAPRTATVARAADDEFAIMLDGELSVDDLTRTAETLRSVFDAPFDAAGAELVVTASIGIAGPTRSETAEELVRKADVAMNQAKNAGRNQVMAFEAKIDRALGSRAAMLSGLRQAVARRRIDVAFQPIYDVQKNRLYGLEALARWVDPEQGRIAPGVFIAVAEDGGLMLELGALIFARALEHAATIEREFILSVNISVQQLADHGFSGLMLNALKAAGWPPDRLILEMTESVLAEDRRVVKHNLTYLREAGVHIAIDDFGTGYSSLSQLHEFPIDFLKIDRKFIEQIETEAGSETVRAIIAIGRALELEIIAEGVENEGQLEVLRELGCRYIQGFLFGQPLFASDLKRLSTRVR